jgi:predicted DNA-binding protein
MTTQMIIRMDSEMKSRLNKLARVEGKTTSQMVRELIEDYMREKDIGAYIDNLWDRIGGRMKAKGIKQMGINRAIKESRKSR